MRDSGQLELEKLFNILPSPAELPEVYEAILIRLADKKTNQEDLQKSVKIAQRTANQILIEFNALKFSCDELFEQMDFGFLLDKERKVFVIGYNVEADKPDNSFYDLLASEARLASFVAIAKDEIPQEHWFRLGRPLTPLQGSRALISWTATMFEYLMPILVMRDYDETLLDQTYKSVVKRQIEYAGKKRRSVGNFRSRIQRPRFAFELSICAVRRSRTRFKTRFERRFGHFAVFDRACRTDFSRISRWKNFAALEKVGALARFGFYESIDYTPERLPPNKNQAIIRAFMAHHQGMILVALDNVLHNNIMQRRFSLRTARSGNRTASSGENSARCSRTSSTRRRSFVGTHCTLDFRARYQIFSTRRRYRHRAHRFYRTANIP